ncbi:hypothetical protein E2562_035589 [Oryza meyeriana var. granulata]|uniref:Uncharacterized protein n=1 Tax=Oryza meyeriana var. granulata TaxID=110450 RepID=A0A6G1ESR6_9ORYZ|nr:hypothetical protein E2562_035589 [Oryza meyeriana var. granulata]
MADMHAHAPLGGRCAHVGHHVVLRCPCTSTTLGGNNLLSWSTLAPMETGCRTSIPVGLPSVAPR